MAKHTRSKTPYSKQVNAASKNKNSTLIDNLIPNSSKDNSKTSTELPQSADITPSSTNVATTSGCTGTGPSWTEFNQLKQSLNEMHELVKSLQVVQNNKSVNTNDSPMVDSANTVVVNKPGPTSVSVGLPNTVTMTTTDEPIVIPDNNIVNQGASTSSDSNKSHTNTPMTTGRQIQTSIDDYLQTFVQNPTFTGENLYNQPGRPIDLKVPDKIRQKIWSNQYIDLSVLLDPTQHQSCSLTIISDPGEPIRFGPASKPKVISALGQWCSAFEIFITVYCQKYPEALSSLMTYMNSIKSLNHKGGDYLNYDQEFRYLKQSTNMSWDTIHTGLWLEYRDTTRMRSQQNKNKGSNNNNNSFRPPNSSNKPSQGKQHPYGYCFRFHTFGKCGRNSCRFNHGCYICNDEGHSYIRCPKQANTKTANSTSNS